MSARAAWRLESLGFTQVFDYVTGKQDWLAAGLPREGKLADTLRAGDLARRDVPTCGVQDLLGEARKRATAAGRTITVVLNEAEIVLGLVSGERFEADAQTPVEFVMESSPKTLRPHMPLTDLITDVQQHERGSVLITTPEGKLLGVVFRQDAEQALATLR
jgi:CBS domain-containing protein